jgi:hypothetical protein
MSTVTHPVENDEFRVVVVGGGIAGLYCARELAKGRLDRILVLERRDDLGGRIETGDLRGFVGTTPATRPTFKAEFGPMRFELGIQPCFKRLCEELGIEFEPFSRPGGPRAPIGYPLPPDECGTDGATPLAPLELLKLGIFRLFNRPTQTVASQDEYGNLRYEVQLIDPAWLASANDDAPHGFDHLRRTATSQHTGRPLWQEGFWNALAEPGILSPLAVRMIQNEGAFYHLIPQNPNAVEWAIFWLRIFKDPAMKTIPSGVRTVTERLEAELRSTTFRRAVTIRCNAEVTAVHNLAPDGGRVVIEVADHDKDAERPNYRVTADDVIFALPKAPLTELAARSGFPTDTSDMLDSVIGFTLLKVFLCGRVPAWWPASEAPRSQDRAWLTSTREVHYFRKGESAMTLLYMDEPSSQYWAHRVQATGDHDRAEYGGNLDLKRVLVEFVFDTQRAIAHDMIPKPASPREAMVDATDEAAQRLLKLIEQVPDESFTRPDSQAAAYSRMRPEVRALLAALPAIRPFWADVSDYAIRDWSRMPFGAGCHAWRLGAQSWDVRNQLSAFAIAPGGRQNAHICGEAYSDYQGFIEGALRSAEDTVDKVLGRTPRHIGPW